LVSTVLESIFSSIQPYVALTRPISRSLNFDSSLLQVKTISTVVADGAFGTAMLRSLQVWRQSAFSYAYPQAWKALPEKIVMKLF